MFTSRADAHQQAFAAMIKYNNFRDGKLTVLAEVQQQLLQQAAVLHELIAEDDEVLERGLSALTDLDQLRLTAPDEAESESVLDLLFGDAPQEDVAIEVSDETEQTNRKLLSETLSRILGIFELDSPCPSQADYVRDHRTLDRFLHAFAHSELDTLRQTVDRIQGEDESPFSVPLHEASDVERGFRALFKRMVDTVETRTQYVKVSNAADVLTALLDNDQPRLQVAAAREYNLLLRLRMARLYGMFLGSLDGRLPEAPRNLPFQS
jgi:hypothetical protein